MPLPSSVSVSVRYNDQRGDYAMVITSENGPCGTCKVLSSCFITRAGVTVCAACDLKEDIRWRSSQRQKKS